MIRFVKILFIGVLMYQTALLFWAGQGVCAAGDIGADDYKQKIDALKDIQEKVTDRIDTALAVRAELTARGREFTGEIKDVQQHHRFSSYAEANRNPRVHYNLKLLQMVSGYTAALDQKIAFFKDGLEQIRFLNQQAEDEAKMIQVVGALDNDRLPERIDRLLIDYRAVIQKDLIESACISFRPCEAIWREIVAKNL